MTNASAIVGGSLIVALAILAHGAGSHTTGPGAGVEVGRYQIAAVYQSTDERAQLIRLEKRTGVLGVCQRPHFPAAMQCKHMSESEYAAWQAPQPAEEPAK